MSPCVSAMTAEEPPEELSTSQGQVKDTQTSKEGETSKEEVCDTTTDPLPSTDRSQEEETASTESEEVFCRICHEGSQSGELLSPCDCSGTLAMVHQSCLEHWLTASNSSHCELCQHQFCLERLPKPFTEWLCTSSMQQQRRTLCGDILCFLFITPLASLSGWLCVQGAMDLYYTNGVEALGLLVLTMALFTIYVFWSVVSVRYHLHLLRTWRTTDQRVRLKIPSASNTDHSHHQVITINITGKNTNKET